MNAFGTRAHRAHADGAHAQSLPPHRRPAALSLVRPRAPRQDLMGVDDFEDKLKELEDLTNNLRIFLFPEERMEAADDGGDSG